MNFYTKVLTKLGVGNDSQSQSEGQMQTPRENVEAENRGDQQRLRELGLDDNLTD